MSTKTAMAALAMLVITLVAPLVALTGPATAQEERVYPWCSAIGAVGEECAFDSLEQCRASSKLCIQNPAYSETPSYAAPHPGRTRHY
jgi:uncharacterized protein DUF3551